MAGEDREKKASEAANKSFNRVFDARAFFGATFFSPFTSC